MGIVATLLACGFNSRLEDGGGAFGSLMWWELSNTFSASIRCSKALSDRWLPSSAVSRDTIPRSGNRRTPLTIRAAFARTCCRTQLAALRAHTTPKRRARPLLAPVCLMPCQIRSSADAEERTPAQIFCLTCFRPVPALFSKCFRRYKFRKRTCTRPLTARTMKKKRPSVSFPTPGTRSPGLIALLTNDTKAWREFEAREAMDDLERLFILRDHYGVAPGGPFVFHELALALARELYPERPPRGRPTKWDRHAQSVLWVEIKRLLDQQDYSVRSACDELASRDLWKAFLASDEGADACERRAAALRQVYKKSKENDRWNRLYWNAFLYNEEKWEAELPGNLGLPVAQKQPD